MTRKSDTSSFFCFTYFRQLSMKALISACISLENMEYMIVT